MYRVRDEAATVNNNGAHEVTTKRGARKKRGDTVTVDNNGKHKVEHEKELHSTQRPLQRHFSHIGIA